MTFQRNRQYFLLSGRLSYNHVTVSINGLGGGGLLHEKDLKAKQVGSQETEKNPNLLNYISIKVNQKHVISYLPYVFLKVCNNKEGNDTRALNVTALSVIPGIIH